jgi:antitoxin HigA-1
MTADTDLRLARYFGLSEGYWLRLQNSYDIMQARREAGKVIDRIKPFAAQGQESAYA